jgi:hypothetical protein
MLTNFRAEGTSERTEDSGNGRAGCNPFKDADMRKVGRSHESPNLEK